MADRGHRSRTRALTTALLAVALTVPAGAALAVPDVATAPTPPAAPAATGAPLAGTSSDTAVASAAGTVADAGTAPTAVVPDAGTWSGAGTGPTGASPAARTLSGAAIAPAAGTVTAAGTALTAASPAAGSSPDAAAPDALVLDDGTEPRAGSWPGGVVPEAARAGTAPTGTTPTEPAASASAVPLPPAGPGLADVPDNRDCVAGEWVTYPEAGLPDERYATEHVSFRWEGDLVSPALAASAGEAFELFWRTYLDPDGIGFPEPDCASEVKHRVNVHVDNRFGLTGGIAPSGKMGIWINAGGLSDRWGLAHELVHALQGQTGGMQSSPYSGMVWEMHANWMTHQLPENRANVHCSEDQVNLPHLAYGASRIRYCNWQFLEFVKNAYGYDAVHAIWALSPRAGEPGQAEADPWGALADAMGWTVAELGDVFGAWAMHNVTWDYTDPDGTDQGAVYRAGYGPNTAWEGRRTLRLTTLDAVADVSGRWTVPIDHAPQRWGYNLVRLEPEPGATTVTVGFRGLVQREPAVDVTDDWPGDPALVGRPLSGWRWGVVVEQADGSPRYSELRRETTGTLEVALRADDAAVHLVVLAAPRNLVRVAWDHPYHSLYRYPWTVDLAGAVPAAAPVPAGAAHPNGGGWVASGASVAATAYVGPQARVLGGTVSGQAQILDHATVLGGTVSGSSRVEGVSVVRNWATVTDDAVVRTAAFGVGAEHWGTTVRGTAQILGDVELWAAERSEGAWYGHVTDDTTTPYATAVPEVTARPTAAELAGPAVPEPGPEAGENVAGLALPAASYTAPWNRVAAVNDGVAFNTGGDHAALWGTWSGSRPPSQWLQYTWGEPVTVDRVALTFWWDNAAGNGEGVAVPAAWELLYRDAAGAWLPVPEPSGYPVVASEASEVAFAPVTTTALRVVLTAAAAPSGTPFSAVGVSEWAVLWATTPPDVTAPQVSLTVTPAPVAGWSGTAVTVTVTAVDDRDEAPVVEFRWGEEWVAYTEPVEVAAEGVHEVAARASDAAGNTSEVVTETVRVDLTPPQVEVAVDAERVVTVAAADAGSGLDAVEIRVGSGAWQAYAGPVPLDSRAVTVTARASDVVGHVGEASLAVPQRQWFDDVPPDHPFFAEIQWLADRGVTSGTPTATGWVFRPGDRMSRQGMAAFLHRYAGAAHEPAPGTQTFTDVPPTHPFFAEIEWMAAEGLTTGYGDGTFAPGGTVSRQAMAAFLHRLAGTPAPEAGPGFTDVGPDHPFAEAIAWLAGAGVSTGYADGSFGGTRDVSRQAMAAFLHRFDALPAVPG